MKQFQINVSENDLKHFFRSIITHTSRFLVKKWLEESGLVWKAYWGIPLDARPWFIIALLWSEIYPTASQVMRILENEKRQAATSAILNYYSTWWSNTKPMQDVMDKVFENMTTKVFLKYVKKNSYIVIQHCKEEFLPLVMSIMSITNDKYLMADVHRRLKDETPLLVS